MHNIFMKLTLKNKDFFSFFYYKVYLLKLFDNYNHIDSIWIVYEDEFSKKTPFISYLIIIMKSKLLYTIFL